MKMRKKNKYPWTLSGYTWMNKITFIRQRDLAHTSHHPRNTNKVWILCKWMSSHCHVSMSCYGSFLATLSHIMLPWVSVWSIILLSCYPFRYRCGSMRIPSGYTLPRIVVCIDPLALCRLSLCHLCSRIIRRQSNRQEEGQKMV